VAYDPTNDRYLVVYIYDVNGDGSDYDLRGRLIPWNGPDRGATYPIVSMFDNVLPISILNNHIPTAAASLCARRRSRKGLSRLPSTQQSWTKPGRRQQMGRRGSRAPALGAQLPLTLETLAKKVSLADCFGSSNYEPGEP